jgi:hypothetical protein
MLARVIMLQGAWSDSVTDSPAKRAVSDSTIASADVAALLAGGHRIHIMYRSYTDRIHTMYISYTDPIHLIRHARPPLLAGDHGIHIYRLLVWYTYHVQIVYT